MELERYGYSSREPPVYTVEARASRRPVAGYLDSRPPRGGYRRYSASEVSRSSDSDFTVENPPDGGMWAWLVVLACAVLHVCSELTQIIFYNTIVIAKLRNPQLVSANETPKDTYTEHMVFEDVVYAGEIVAAVFAVVIGYRATCVLGSLCTIGGFLGASYCDPTDHHEAFGFLVGFLGGLGVSFWRYTAYVAIMEYFQRYRLTALILSGFGRAVGIFIGYGVLATPLKTLLDGNINDIKDKITDWEIYYRCAVAMPAVAAIVSLIITPLRYAPAQTRTAEHTRLFKCHDTWMCRGFMLIFTITVYFIHYMGGTLPNTTMLYWMIGERFITRHILAALFTFASGVTVGYIMLAFWPTNAKLFKTLIWMGVFSVTMGVLTLIIPVFDRDHTPYVVSYMGILGISQVLFESLLRYVIPIGFGRTHIRWIEGFLGLAAGLATLCNNFVAREIRTEKPEFIGNIFYLAGAGFLAAGVLAIGVMNLTVCFQVPDDNQEKHPALPPKEPLPRSSRRDIERSYGRQRDVSPPRIFHGYQYR